MNDKLKIGIQKSGRLSESSLKLIKECGIKMLNEDRKLRSESSNFSVEILFLRDDDIPQYVEKGVVDVGIIGENVLIEKKQGCGFIRTIRFCQLSSVFSYT